MQALTQGLRQVERAIGHRGEPDAPRVGETG